MYVIKPIVITNPMIISNNIAASPQDEWDENTVYIVNQEVQVSSNHKIYNCTVANTGEDPVEQTRDGNNDLYWTEIDTTNDFAIFDGRSRRSSTNSGSIIVEFQPNKNLSSISILNIQAETLNVKCTSASALAEGVTDGIIFNFDFVLRELTDTYYDFCFSEIESVSSVVKLNDIPIYNDTIIRVEATSSSGDVTIGEIVTGLGVKLGTTNYGTSVGINDFSTKNIDETFGDVFVIERGFNSTVNYDVWMEPKRVAYVKKLLAQYRATPLVFIGNPDIEETVVYGFYKNFDAVLENYGISTMLLEVEELSV